MVVSVSLVATLSFASLPPSLLASPSALCQLRRCIELGRVSDVSGEVATFTTVELGLEGNKLLGERSRAGAASGMPVQGNALPETPALENILMQGHAAGEKKNVGHSYKMGNSVWGHSYTEKDLAVIASVCLGMWASSIAAWGQMDEHSSSGYKGLGGDDCFGGSSVESSAEHRFCFGTCCLERCCEIRKCSKRKCRIIGGLENLPSSERN